MKIFFVFIVLLFFFSLSSRSSLSSSSLVYSIVSSTNERPHYTNNTSNKNHTLKNHGESTRGVLLGARMAVREEEQRVRPRVREPNAHVRGERQRDREARI